MVLSDKVNNGDVEVITASNYYPFGMEQYGNSWNGGDYRFGFNGKEKDPDFGTGNVYDYGFRIYNPRLGKFLSVDPLTSSYPMLTPYQFASNRPIDGVDLDGLEYVKFTHTMDKGGQRLSTKMTIYYKMSETELLAHGGTPAGRYNAGGYGPGGEGVLHQYVVNGSVVTERWDLPRNGFMDQATTHGLYSGSGCITNFDRDYDFGWQPIDIADAIAKGHDMDYDEATKEGNDQGYVEDVRTLVADLRMVSRVNQVLNNGATAEDLGLEIPVRSDIAGETMNALRGQKLIIGMMADYKGWKINQANNGAEISILNEEHRERYINAAVDKKQKRYRKTSAGILRKMEEARREENN